MTYLITGTCQAKDLEEEIKSAWVRWVAVPHYKNLLAKK